MFAHIEGVLCEKNADSLVIDCGGVGYLIYVSGTALSGAPAIGERMKVYTILNVREDAMELYGFSSPEEKRMFERMRAVSGVGPKSALQILSTLSLRDLSLALVSGDAAALTRAPGIGKKIAQRLVLELRDKIDNEELTGAPAALSPARGAMGPENEAVEALMALGYAPSEAARAVAGVAGQSDRTDELIRLALKGMNG